LVRAANVVGVAFECDYPPEACSRRILSTSALPSELSAAEIDTAVAAALAQGEDLYHLDRDALADLDPDPADHRARAREVARVDHRRRWRWPDSGCRG
jgi:hypothetical protein